MVSGSEAYRRGGSRLRDENLERDVVVASRKVLVAALLLSALAVTPSVAAVPGATTHPTYPLGHARSCKAHYVKRTEKHKVGASEIRYVACVYVASLAVAPTTTTVATTTTVPTTTLTPSFIAICNGLPAPIGVSVTQWDCVFNMLTSNLPYPECNAAANFGTLTLTSPASAPGAGTMSVSWGGVCGGSTVESEDVNFGAIGFSGTETSWTYSGGSYIDVQGQRVVLPSELLTVSKLVL
jgi:hypothetical protein